jgi:segregation and condensation protein B
MEKHDIESAIEAILFVSGDPVKLSRIAAVLGIGESDAEDAANRIRDRFSFERRGFRLVMMDGDAQLCSSPEYADYIRLALETRKPPQLSQPALEVLAAVAYFQPVTRVYIEQIRGVDSAYTLGLLMERGFIETCGRLPAPGRPMLYRTTHVFLRTFGLESLRELPELPKIEGGAENREGIQNAILELKAREEVIASLDAVGGDSPGRDGEATQDDAGAGYANAAKPEAGEEAQL